MREIGTPSVDPTELWALYPLVHPFKKGKAVNAVSIAGAGAVTNFDLDTTGYDQLVLLARMTAAAAPDLALGVHPYEDDGSTNFGQDTANEAAVAAGFSGGVVKLQRMLKLRGMDKVRLVAVNNNAGAQTLTIIYFLQR